MIVAFVASLLSTKYFIHFCKYAGLVGKDMHKHEHTEIPATGGMGVYVGILLALCLYVLVTKGDNALELFGVLLTLSIITYIGFFDDITKDKGGLEQWQKPVFTVLAVIPLMVLRLGTTAMVLPFIGWFDFGWAFTFIIIPISIIGASNMVNLLGGYNGLETGLGIIYIGMLTIYANFKHQEVAVLIGLATVLALLGFLIFNWYPSKIFPGDSLTYLLGGVLVSMALVGNFEKAALVVSIPFFIEFVLKIRGRFKQQSFSQPYTEGKLIHSGTVYSLPQVLTRTGKFSEQQVVMILIGFELLCSLFIWII